MTTGGSGGNAIPLAHAGPGRGAAVHEAVQLDGRKSRDPEAKSLSFRWSLDSAPSGSNATISGSETSVATLAPDVVGEYRVRLVVHDGEKASEPAFTTVVADHGATHRVGPGRTFETPSACAAVARDGDTITIDATDYPGDVAVWRAQDLTIHGIGGRAHIVGRGRTAEDKALWVVKGARATIENIEFSGATSKDENGAGIRGEGTTLTLRNCSFHDCENGILVGNNAQSVILVERCEFARNGFGRGQTHNLYINQVKSLTVLFSTFVGVRVGHHIKSRAARTTILYCRMLDERDGSASYAIDLPNGGIGIAIGNQIHQGLRSSNSIAVAFGAEGASHPVNELHFVHNTIVNDRATGTFVRVWSGGYATLRNNLFVGVGDVLYGAGTSIDDVRTSSPSFVDKDAYDYALRADSPAIDAGSDPGVGGGMSLTPTFEVDRLLGVRPRVARGLLDAGALEYTPAP